MYFDYEVRLKEYKTAEKLAWKKSEKIEKINTAW